MKGNEARWKKSPPELIARFDAALPCDTRVHRRVMFGCPCAFVNGHLFAGLHQDSLFVRLAAGDREALLARPGASRFEPVPGRQMAEYVVVPGTTSRPQLAKWLILGLEYAASLAPKQSRRRAKV